MTREEILRRIYEVAAQLTPEDIAEVIEEHKKKTAPVSHTEAVSANAHISKHRG